MRVIVESGATKTDWRILEQNGAVESVETEGVNPFHQSFDEILSIVSHKELVDVGAQVKSVNFYGAGCNYPDKILRIEDALRRVFPQAEIDVTHDLLAAARACTGGQEGIACILGTGSNACFFNGDEIVETSPSLGYILGDEGSGAYLGKKLIQDFLFKKMPASVSDLLTEKFDLEITTVLERVYSRPNPHKYLSSFAPFIFDNLSHPYVHGLVYECFYDFLDKHLRSFPKHKSVPINFVGSVAYYFREVLEKVLVDAGLTFGNVVKSPIVGLVKFHKNKA